MRTSTLFSFIVLRDKFKLRALIESSDRLSWCINHIFSQQALPIKLGLSCRLFLFLQKPNRTFYEKLEPQKHRIFFVQFGQVDRRILRLYTYNIYCWVKWNYKDTVEIAGMDFLAIAQTKKNYDKNVKKNNMKRKEIAPNGLSFLFLFCKGSISRKIIKKPSGRGK